MDTVLAWLVSGWSVIESLVTWAAANPAASAFFGAVALAIIDRIVKATPWRGDDCLLDIMSQAVARGMSRARGGH